MHIAILATLDTKGLAAVYLRDQIESFGDRAIVIDTGVVGSPTGFHPTKVAKLEAPPWISCC